MQPASTVLQPPGPVDLPGAAELTAVERTREIRAAIGAVVPLLLGLLPFGLVVGARVADGDVVSARWLSTALIMGGSAQLTVLELLDRGAPIGLVVASGLLVNARLVAYSASLAPEWASASARFRALAAASVIDPTWWIAQRRRGEPGGVRARRLHYTVAGTTLCVGWLVIVTAGAFLGAAGGFRSADVVVPLCLFALVAPRLAGRAERLPMVVAGFVGWLAADLSAGLGVALAAGAAVAIGGLRDRKPVRDGDEARGGRP
jgi:predicted branched-subunit amino acid permease